MTDVCTEIHVTLKVETTYDINSDFINSFLHTSSSFIKKESCITFNHSWYSVKRYKMVALWRADSRIRADKRRFQNSKFINLILGGSKQIKCYITLLKILLTMYIYIRKRSIFCYSVINAVKNCTLHALKHID